ARRQRRTSARGCGLRRATARRRRDRDERWAVAFEAGVVAVAGRVVDLALLAELGHQREHRQAVALGAAVTAAFAHRGVDDHPCRWGLELSPLAQPPGLGSAALVVDDHGDAPDVAQLVLHVFEVIA